MLNASVSAGGGDVTSFTLVWIKMRATDLYFFASSVTSFTLVWIKMAVFPNDCRGFGSRASRSCGLKFNQVSKQRYGLLVTSFTLVWIKILE